MTLPRALRARPLPALRLATRSAGSSLSTPSSSKYNVASTSAPAAFVTDLTSEDALEPMTAGARIGEMHRFWVRLGLADPISRKLARQGSRFGSAWSNPPALLRRLHSLQAALPTLKLAPILDQAPGLLLYDPQRLRGKLVELSVLLPGVDVLKLVATAPDVLQRDMSKVTDRVHSLRTLPRSDVDALIAEHPQLLREHALALRDRIQVLPRAYAPVLLQRIPRQRLAGLLRFSANRLMRLEYLSARYPGVRGRISDMKVLRMSTANFQEGFKLRRMTPRRMNAAKSTRALGPRQPIADVPMGANVFRLGERQLSVWRESLEHERRHILERGNAPTQPAFPRRNQGRRPPQMHPDFARIAD